MTPFAVLSGLGTLQQLRATAQGWSRRLVAASIYGVVALIFALVTIVFLGLALFFWLSDMVSPVSSAIIVAIVMVVLAGIAGLLARHAIRRGRGGTGSALPAATHADDLLGAGLNTNTLFALGAGLVGGLIAAQLRNRSSRKSDKD